MVGESNITPIETVQPVAEQPTTTTPTITPTVATIGEPKKSIFKKWWLWAIIGVIIIGIVLFFIL